MSWAAFIDNMLVNVCGLLLSVLMLKQIIMNTIGLFTPQCKQPKRFRAHKSQMQAHFDKEAFREDYGEDSEAAVANK